MPDLKISQLAAGTTPLAGTELVPIVQSGVTSRTTVGAIMTSTVPSGTANGVLYLNGSKVATSGSALVFDGSNLGVGTSSPTAKLEVRTDVQAATSLDSTAIKLLNNLDGGSGIEFSNGVAGKSKLSFGVESSGAGTDDTYISFSTCLNAGALTERARITSGGDLLVGCLATPSATVSGVVLRNPISSSATVFSSGTTNSATLIAFFNDNGQVGRIDVGGSATSYVTSSDRRLKENITPADAAGAVIDAIEVVQHDWKAGGHTRYGMIAQDLHTVAPEAVSVGDDGDEIEKAWGVDYSKLVPMLIKEIQSLRARVAALEQA